MALYRVEFTKSAQKKFDKLPDKVQPETIEALHLLSLHPYLDY